MLKINFNEYGMESCELYSWKSVLNPFTITPQDPRNLSKVHSYVKFVLIRYSYYMVEMIENYIGTNIFLAPLSWNTEINEMLIDCLFFTPNAEFRTDHYPIRFLGFLNDAFLGPPDT